MCKDEQRRSLKVKSFGERLFLFIFPFRGIIMQKEGQIRIPSGCAIAAVISTEGNKMTGEKIIESMKPMHDRSNGLGGGFAALRNY